MVILIFSYFLPVFSNLLLGFSHRNEALKLVDEIKEDKERIKEIARRKEKDIHRELLDKYYTQAESGVWQQNAIERGEAVAPTIQQSSYILICQENDSFYREHPKKGG